MNTVIAAQCFLALLCGPAPAQPTFDDIENWVVAARRQIARGEVLIDATEISGTSGVLAAEHRVWFDGDKLRQDTTIKRAAVAQRSIRCRNCPGPGGWILFSGEKPNVNVVAQVMQIPPQKKDNPWFHVMDARGLGIVPHNAEHTAALSIEQAMKRPGRKDFMVHEETWQGRRCLRLDSTFLHGTTQKIWVVPECDYNVVKIRAGTVLEGIEYTVSLENELGQFGPQKRWFPKKCTYVRKEQGVVTCRQVARMTVKSFNERIDPAVFTLAGVNLPIGTLVRTDTSEELKVWDGEKLVDKP